MEYTERKGTYYIGGKLRIKQTPDGWTLFERKNMQSNDYESMPGEHYATKDQALDAAEIIMEADKLCRG